MYPTTQFSDSISLHSLITSEIADFHLEQIDRIFSFEGFKGFSCWLSSEFDLKHSKILSIEEDFTVQLSGVKDPGAPGPAPSAGWLNRPDYGQIRLDQNARNLSTIPAGIYDNGNYPAPFDTTWNWAGQIFRPPNNGNLALIWVLDSGVFPNHQEFTDNGKPTRVTQLTNFAPNDPGDVGDCNGHGTHVAAKAAGFYKGVASGAELRSVRVFNCNGQAVASDVVSGINFIATNVVKDRPNIVVVAFSFNASDTLDNAFNAAVDNGLIVLAAAGDNQLDAKGYSPGRAAQVITIGSTDASDYIAFFSNYGTALKALTPGLNIMSAWIDSSGTQPARTDYYNEMSGTGYGLGHVAGAVAVYATLPGVDSSPSGVQAVIASKSVKGAIKGLTGTKASTPNQFIWDQWL